MSGYNNNELFDDAKDFLTKLLKEHKSDFALGDEGDDDDDTVGDSSNSSPATTSPGTPITATVVTEYDLTFPDTIFDEKGKNYLETADDLLAMSNHIDEMLLAAELYNALIKTPLEEMPPMLADAMEEWEGEHSSPSDEVSNLIKTVVAAATLPPTIDIKTLEDGTYELNTNVNGIGLSVQFGTLEQIALALVYAELKVVNSKAEPEHVRKNALDVLIAVVTDYNLNFNEGIQKHIDNGVNIPQIIDGLLERQNSSSSKRLKM